MIRLSEHAILRYIERVKPGFQFPKAKHELEALVEMAGETLTPGHPEWYMGEHEEVDGHLPIADGIAGIVIERQIVTIVVRGGSNPVHRERRNKRKAQKRNARRLKSKQDKRGRGRPPVKAAAWD